MVESPNFKFASKTLKEETFKKTTENYENYSLNIKIKDNNSIYISLKFDEDDKIYEDIKFYENIKKKHTYFEDYSLEEIYDELNDLISKNNIEIKRNYEQILFNIILPFKKRKHLILYYKLTN